MIRTVLFDVQALAYGPSGAELFTDVLRGERIAVEAAQVAEALGRLPEQIRQARLAIRTQEQENDYHRALLPLLLENLGVRHPADALLLRLVESIHQYSAYWSLYPETLPVLEALRGQGIRLGVVANWEPSLPRFLAEFELDSYFQAVLSSMAEGVAKPDPILFHRALKAMGARAEEALHIGPSMEEDVAGAIASGIRPVWLNRLAIPTGHEVVSITDLRGLLLILGKGGH